MNNKTFSFFKDFGFFKHIIKKYKLCEGTIDSFSSNNGFSKNTFCMSWKYHGIPTHARFALKKEIEIFNLTQSLKGNSSKIITEEMINKDYEEYITIH